MESLAFILPLILTLDTPSVSKKLTKKKTEIFISLCQLKRCYARVYSLIKPFGVLQKKWK